MDALFSILKNHVLTVAILSWFTAQVMKTIINYFVTKRLNLERLVGAGGMPSCHSAMVAGLVISMSKVAGPSSPEFALSFVLASIVMYDAMGVRRAAGEQAKVLNKLVSNIKISEETLDEQYEHEDEDYSESSKQLKEFLGHTPLEVLAGALLGILVAMIVPA